LGLPGESYGVVFPNNTRAMLSQNGWMLYTLTK
jgi:hypothetical protein